MTNLLELAKRCEKAMQPDRTLDADIFKAIGMPLPHEFLSRGIGLSWDALQNAFTMPLDEKMQVRFDHPAYSASIDAAMTLVPEKWHWDVGSDNIAIARNAKNSFDASTEALCVASSPALALCGVAMRARASALTSKEG